MTDLCERCHKTRWEYDSPAYLCPACWMDWWCFHFKVEDKYNKSKRISLKIIERPESEWEEGMRFSPEEMEKLDG